MYDDFRFVYNCFYTVIFQNTVLLNFLFIDLKKESLKKMNLKKNLMSYTKTLSSTTVFITDGTFLEQQIII